MSTLTQIPLVTDGSLMTAGFFNSRFQGINDNFNSLASGVELSVLSNASTGFLYAQQGIAIGPGSYPPSDYTTAGLTIAVSSAGSDYLHLVDSSGGKSNYVIGSRAGGTADGLNIWDASGDTMIVSFSKQSIRFYQQVVGPVFDTGGSVTSTLHAGTFGTAADSKESRIQAAILAASLGNYARVLLPQSMLPYSASSISFVYPVQMVREGGDWLRYDVRAYGASGDSVTNDTVAVQQAMYACDATGGGSVYVPLGVYSITSLTFPGDGIALTGEGSHYAYSSVNRTGTILRARSGSAQSFVNLVLTGLEGDVSGCRIANLTIDGALQTSNGINVSGANIIENVFVRGCLEAGVRIRNWTNSVHLRNVGLIDNFGYGLYAEGEATTPFSVVDSNINLNQLGGVNIEGGFVCNFANCVVEGNGRANLRIFRPDSNANLLGNFLFTNCWFEDSRTTGIFIGANNPSEYSAPSRIRFDYCKISASSQSYYVDVYNGKLVTFNHCNFSGSSHTNAITVTNASYDVAVIESATTARTLADGLSQAQTYSMIANGVRCYVSDRQSKSSVTVFTNSWVNWGAPYSDAKFWFDYDGMVNISGAIKSGTITLPAFTLPVGYRPPTTMDFAVESNGAHGIARIDSGGVVTPYVGSNGIFNFTGIRYTTHLG